MGESDGDIISRLKKGDESGLRLLFDNYYKPLCLFALRYIDSFDKSEDIVQEVFITFWENKKADQITSTLRNYLYKAVKNNALNYLRSNSRYRLEAINEELELMVEVPDDEQHEDLEEKRERLFAEIDKLSPQAKAVFESVIIGSMKYKEVAEEMGISVNTVKTTLSRALKRLRTSLNMLLCIILH
ncbi:RNA polymerase sigma factor [Carboxylicivirga taeanensis]|uniref:RNA polymerase sigma factor n=1 Tax=Carboxylicivirga taeanensis TaxID=1416875 RepID=UPI003F6E3DC3